MFVDFDDGAPPLLDALGAVGLDLHGQIGGGTGVGPVHLFLLLLGLCHVERPIE